MDNTLRGYLLNLRRVEDLYDPLIDSLTKRRISSISKSRDVDFDLLLLCIAVLGLFRTPRFPFALRGLAMDGFISDCRKYNNIVINTIPGVTKDQNIGNYM